MNDIDENKNEGAEPEDISNRENSQEKSPDVPANDILSILFEGSPEKAYQSRHAMEISQKGFTRKSGRFLMTTETNKNHAGFGAEVAASLTDANFEDSLVRELWEMLPEEIHNSALIDFQCSICLLLDELGLTKEDIREMKNAQLDAAMEKAMMIRRAKPLKETASGASQIEDIHIFFGPSNAPGSMEGRNAIQITGNCTRCGSELVRTLTGKHAHWIGSMGTLMKAEQNMKKGKPGRNDSCPCGSGLKYKKCCGKES